MKIRKDGPAVPPPSTASTSATWELFSLKLLEQEGAPGSSQLEQALFYAGQSRDIPSLTSLARQESNRADLAEQMLVAVLEAAGPTRIQRGVISQHGTRGRVSLVSDGEEWAILSAQPSEILGAAGGVD